MRTFIVITIVAFFMSCSSSNDNQYALTVQETLDIVNSKVDILSADEVAKIILAEGDIATQPYQLIDIRTPQEFTIWHVPGAVNMPAKNILSNEYTDLLNNQEVVKVFYCKGSHQSMNVYVELTQLGYKNLKVSLGGFAFIRDHIIDTLSIETGVYNEDAALYDYAKIVKETAGGSIDSGDKTAKPKKKVARRKKKGVEGGCG